MRLREMALILRRLGMILLHSVILLSGILLAGILLSGIVLSANQPSICLAEDISLSPGVLAWKDGNLEEAQKFFDALLIEQPNSRELQSNRGFLALEMKDHAAALFHLRKAHKLGERSPQLTKALKTIRESHSRSFVDSPQQTPWYLAPLTSYSTNGLGWLTLSGFLALTLAIYLSLSLKKAKTQSIAKVSLLIISFTALPLSLLAYFSQPAWPEALVISLPWSPPITEVAIAKSNTPVLYQPAEDSQVVFMLNSADEVPIIERNKDWTEVSLPGYRKGWVKNSSLYRLSED
ncbi:MAG: SH3 domain-containing protein [bacterium]|nr:SH3 domain-containing protein [bacterium]